MMCVFSNIMHQWFKKHGFVKNKTVIYQNTDCLVMASHNEGFGRVTAEAMANGVVVIGYDGGGTREVIKDKETGYLYQGDEYNLAEIMKYVNHTILMTCHLRKWSIYIFVTNFDIQNVVFQCLHRTNESRLAWYYVM